MTDTRRRALLLFEEDLVIERLQLPAGTAILSARVALELGGLVELLVTHPSLDVVDTGCRPPVRTLVVESKLR